MSSEKYYLTGKLALLMTLSLSNIIISPISSLAWVEGVFIIIYY